MARLVSLAPKARRSVVDLFWTTEDVLVLNSIECGVNLFIYLLLFKPIVTIFQVLVIFYFYYSFYIWNVYVHGADYSVHTL